MLKLEDCVVVEGNVLSAEIEDELVLMDAASGKYFSFRDVSTEIWQEIGQPRQVASLCDKLIATYDASEERIKSSVLKFLEELLERGLIRTV